MTAARFMAANRHMATAPPAALRLQLPVPNSRPSIPTPARHPTDLRAPVRIITAGPQEAARVLVHLPEEAETAVERR